MPVATCIPPGKHQVTLPMVNFSAMMAMAEPLPIDDDQSFENVIEAAKWKVGEVFGKKGTHTSKAMERSWLAM